MQPTMSRCYGQPRLRALYKLGRTENARRIFYPMLKRYTAGEFQGFGPDKHSRDWRTWKGESWGYEGLLVDNYLPLLAVLDDADQVQEEGQHNDR